MTAGDLALARIEWLQSTFFDGTSAGEAVSLFRTTVDGPDGQQTLDRLLRDHRKAPIMDPEEAERRDEFDFLLGYYSVREVAALSGYAPITADDPTLKDAAGILDHPSVLAYYDKHYPLLLPRVFRERLRGRWDRGIDGQPACDGLVEEFLNMAESGYRDDELQTFLWYLDDGWSGNTSLADVVASTMESPYQLVQALASDRRARSAEDAGVIGFSRFLQRCARQDELLESVDAAAIVKAALWHYQGYWYINMRDKVLAVVEKAGRAVDAWQAGASPSPRVRFSDRVKKLMDPARGRPLEQAFRDAM